MALARKPTADAEQEACQLKQSKPTNLSLPANMLTATVLGQDIICTRSCSQYVLPMLYVGVSPHKVCASASSPAAAAAEPQPQAHVWQRSGGALQVRH